jgi:two-component system, cell cycle sensor histidine kinase and response regulator CckA
MSEELPMSIEVSPVAQARTTILVVEDDAQIARLERLQLERSGYRVVVVGNRDDLVQHLREQTFGLMIIDVSLTDGMNGLDLYVEVRAAGFEVPAVLVTELHNDELLIRALRAGVRDILPKSSSFTELLPGVIDRVLAQIRTERRLAESETRLASIIESTLDAILVADADRKVNLMNPSAERMFRCSAQAGIGRPLDDFLPAGFLHATPTPGDSNGTPLPRQLLNSMQARRADGERFPVEVSLSQSWVNDQPFFVAIVRDVTERERAAAKIREQATFLDQANEAIVVREPNGRIVYWNRGAARMYGWSAAEAMAGTVGETLTSAAFHNLASQREALAESGQWSGELWHVRKDQREVAVSSRWSLLRGPDQREVGILVIDSDVTTQKQLEMQFLHAQKMQAIGQLAGGVAHDFNNLLTVVTGTVELLLMQPDLNPPDAHELLTAVHRAGERGASLVRQLLKFSRRDQTPARVVDLNSVVRDIERMLSRLIGSDITFLTSLQPELGCVLANPVQLEQVLVNLVVNACDAMPSGGTLSIETRDVEVGGGNRSGRYVLLTVTDTGHGMDEETLARVFEPFFTTKEVDAGTGLGLATVHGIVQKAGGFVEVESSPGAGAQFRVYLPRQQSRESTRLIPSIPAQGGTESILLVEDDPAVRKTVELILRSLGYTVTVASGGEEALGLLSGPTPVDLLITDVVMPRMKGSELADQVAASFPELRVLFMSGYTREFALGDHLDHPGFEFLRKPFTHDDLGEAVRRTLDSAEPSVRPVQFTGIGEQTVIESSF